MPRLCLFIDYQNTYNGAREAFHAYDAPNTDGQIDPARLGEVIAAKDLFQPELSAVRVYRGRPDSLKDPRGYAANLRQCSAWENASPLRVKVIWRTLRYPRNWPDEAEEEKGIDVALAIDAVMMAVRGEYDIGVVMSTDTDIKPALEEVAQMRADPYPRITVAAWSSPDRHSRRLSISGRQLWCYWLGREDYNACADPTHYGQARGPA
jgi:uncharacterized LabA/DUF88 family protein